MDLPIYRTVLAICLTVMATATLKASDFAPVGSTLNLTVEYRYESAGKQSSEGMYDPRVWRVEQTVRLTTALTAQAPQALPTMQALDAEQVADIKTKQAKAQDMQTQMAPMMANVEEIMAKCGEDEACIEREVQKMGFGMSGTEELAEMQDVQKSAAEVFKPGDPRYQRWQATTQEGTYRINETLHARVTDPICMEIPAGVCTRDEVRKGEGAVPVPPGSDNATVAAAGGASLEMDAQKNSLIIQLPVPAMPLPYIETITTDEPEGTHDTPTPEGPQNKLLSFGGNGPGNLRSMDPMTLAIQGDWRNQTGEKVVEMQGDYGETAKMTIRWSLSGN